MLVTIWMCTQEWSLICRRVTALTLAACHSAFSESSWLTRSISSRSGRLPRAGRLMRMSRTASAGVIRAPRSARTLTGVPGAGSDPAGISSGSGARLAGSLLPPRWRLSAAARAYLPTGITRQPKANASWYQPAPGPM